METQEKNLILEVKSTSETASEKQRIDAETGEVITTATQANELADKLSVYSPRIAALKAQAASIEVNDITQLTEMESAAELLKTAKKLRVEFDKKRKEVKAWAWQECKNIDATANKVFAIIDPIIIELESKAKFKELAEAKIKADLLEKRTKELTPYGVDCSGYNLPEMTEEAYLKLLKISKADFEEEQEKKKAEAEELERLRIENAKAKAEADRIEAERREAARKEAEALAEIERLKKAEADRIEAERRAELAKQSAPDKEKILNYINEIKNISKPEIVSEKYAELLGKITLLIQKVDDFVNDEINKINTK